MVGQIKKTHPVDQPVQTATISASAFIVVVGGDCCLLDWLSNGICFFDIGQPCSVKSRAESVSKIVNGLCKQTALVEPYLFGNTAVDVNLHNYAQ